MTVLSSVADIHSLLANLPKADEKALQAALEREPQLTKPGGALGRLEELAHWLAAWQGRHPARLEHGRCVVFAGNHGVAAKGVSAFPAEVTAQMVENFRAGGAAINQLCAVNGLELTVEETNNLIPTADFTQAPAMTEAEFANAFAQGMRAAQKGGDLLCIGEMGIANTSAAAAVSLALFGGTASEWTGPGTGVAGDALTHKAKVIAQAVERHRNACKDPLEALRHVGGFELAAMAGAVLGARLAHVPVLLDGYVCTAAAAALFAANSAALDHCKVAHCSAEPAHRALAARLHQKPLLDLGMRLGEASGAAVAAGVLRGALACHNGMATFADAGVSDK